MTALYSIGTWDTNVQAYTPQVNAGPSVNVDIHGLRRVLKRLREIGYSAHRRGGPGWRDQDNDWEVLVERTDGAPETEILLAWER